MRAYPGDIRVTSAWLRYKGWSSKEPEARSNAARHKCICTLIEGFNRQNAAESDTFRSLAITGYNGNV